MSKKSSAKDPLSAAKEVAEKALKEYKSILESLGTPTDKPSKIRADMLKKLVGTTEKQVKEIDKASEKAKKEEEKLKAKEAKPAEAKPAKAAKPTKKAKAAKEAKEAQEQKSQ
ncbi:MAG: hypothetical protein QXF49_01090 [Thermosphaera sp.]